MSVSNQAAGHEGAPMRCGIAALVGRPNVGKSTLLNALLGRKVSIVSPKPQTTRNRIHGVLTGPDYQIVFADLPGLHAYERRAINRFMNRTALASLADAPLVDPELVYEPKYDGIRAVAEVDGPVVRLWSRLGHDKAGQFPEVTEALARWARRRGAAAASAASGSASRRRRRPCGARSRSRSPPAPSRRSRRT